MRVYRWLFVTGLVIGVAALFVTFSADRPRERPAASNQIEQETEAVAARGDEVSGALKPPELDLDQTSGPLVIVDSLPPTEQGSLAEWSGVRGSAGHFDVLSVLNGSPPPAAGVSAIEILIARGWAGDTGLGMRLSDVLLARCDRIVARAKVTLDRPDVAKAVHPNLVRSGWEAQLLAGHLPACDNDDLSAWAVLPGDPALLIPLIGRHAVKVDRAHAPEVSHVSAQSVIRPDVYAPPPRETIEVVASRANLRRCGSTKCDVVGQIDRGTHPGIILDSSGDWSLLGFGEVQGWLFNDLFRRAP